jgi:DNA-binding NarL/FixJ family response regulator
MSGCDLAKFARRLQSDIAIISISSWQGRKTAKMAAECGIDVTIWKPFRFDQIMQAVDELTIARAAKAATDRK